MRKYLFLFIAALLVAGCTLQTAGNIYADPTRISVNLTAISNNATATAVSATQVADLLQVEQQNMQPTTTSDAMVQIVAATATQKTNLAATIFISKVVDNGLGSVTVKWDGVGDFSSGFKVIYDKYDDSPELATSSSVYITDPAARSATLALEAGQRYFLRVCRYWNGACDPYSSPAEITLAAAPVPTKTVSVAPTKTSAPTTGSLSIIDIDDVSSGKAIFYWDAVGSFPNGFKIVWSASNYYPVYPGDTWLYVSDPSARSTYVTGTPGQKYYFRICQYLDGMCKFYSDTREFTFANTAPVNNSLTITGMTEISSGTAKIFWTPVGYFPNGYKIAYSETNPTPVYPGDSYVYISDPSVTYAKVYGDPGHTYYYRVCEYTGSGCGVYSNVYTFTFSAPPPEPTPDTSTITITSINPIAGIGGSPVSIFNTAGGASATVYWTTTGDFPDGFKLVWSTSPSPIYPGSSAGYYSPGSTSGTITDLVAGTPYYVRVCKYISSQGSCSIYSNEVTYTP